MALCLNARHQAPRAVPGRPSWKKGVGGKGSVRTPCDREEMMHLCRSRSRWALVPAPASWAELGCQGPAGTPLDAHCLLSAPSCSLTWPWAATTTTSPCTRWRSASDSGPFPQAAMYIVDPPHCPEHLPDLAAEGSRGPALSVCLSSLSRPGAQRRGLSWSPRCDGCCSDETQLLA